jgi:hypothetical protein
MPNTRPVLKAASGSSPGICIPISPQRRQTTCPGVASIRARRSSEVLPNLPNVLDFGRFGYDVFLTENDRVVALVNFGLTGSDATIKISEHWTVKSGKATSIWVAYFEPQALLDKLGVARGLKR